MTSAISKNMSLRESRIAVQVWVWLCIVVLFFTRTSKSEDVESHVNFTIEAKFEKALSDPDDGQSAFLKCSLCEDDPCLTLRSTCLDCQPGLSGEYSNCPGQPPSCCYRGVDHLGEMTGCNSQNALGVMALPVTAFHEVLDALARCENAIVDSGTGEWLHPGPSYLGCAWQCKFVNYRHGSMYLRGCLPEGYDLFCFIESVPHVEFHYGPLHDSGNVEPGGNFEEATLVDGNDSKALSEVALNAEPPAGELPVDRAAAKFSGIETRMHLPGTHRSWNGTSVYWNASLLNHQPLYFEDVNLERHGFSYGYLQPVVSGAKFFATLPALPYLMTAQPQHTTVYSLGESRPGSHACYVHELPPVHLDAALVEAGVITGLIFLIP